MEAEEGVGGAARRRRLGVAALLTGGIAGAALFAGWIERKPIVAHFVDDELARAHVPASYRIAAIGPFVQRLEDVRLGDPAHPDLTAKLVEVELGYGLSGPRLAGIRAEGVRMNGRLVDGSVSLGELDRLMPRSSGKTPFTLPDVRVRLADTQLALETPAGVIGAVSEGQGRLSDGFRGRVAAAAAGGLIAGGCALTAPVADLVIRITDRRPHITGPLRTGGIACPNQGVVLGAGQADLDLGFASNLAHWEGAIGLDGFTGRGGGVRFGALGGRVTMVGDARRMEGIANVSASGVKASGGQARRVAFGGRYRFAPGTSGLILAGDVHLAEATFDPARRRQILSSVSALSSSPVGPLALKAGKAVDMLLAAADADAKVALTAGGPAGAALRLRSLALTGRQGDGFVRVVEGDGFGRQARDRAWRVDGRITTGGGGLPDLDMVLHQRAAGGPVSGVATLRPYEAEGARLGLTPVRFDVAGSVTRFSTVATLDGPLGSGRVEGLTVPVAGRVDRRGFRVGEGCIPVAFRELAISGMVIAPSRISLCGVGGAPVVTGGTGVRFGAVVSNLHLAGRSGAAPLTLTASHVEVTDADLSLAGVVVRLGASEAQTSLDLGSVTGRFSANGLSGRFVEGAGQIRNVPLLLSQAEGEWSLANGILSLKGGLAVADAAEQPRFAPLASHDVALSLANGRITATGTLIEPKSGAKVSEVSLTHDLGSGEGEATLNVPGLTFAPKQLQPEALTPLTLGVIANVVGTVSGKGVIDWSPKGVTSHGDFGTEGIDLAAAFGPVTKIVGTIHFSDLLALATPPHQEATIGEVNPGIAVSNGVVHYQLLPGQKVKVEDARWPFAGGDLVLEPSLLSFEQAAQRHLTFRVTGLDAGAFVQQLAFPNISASGTFDGVLPMIFDQTGGRIEGGVLTARKGGGSLAYVGELTTAQLGNMGKLAFDALKKVRYSSLTINLDGRLDGEIISRVNFDGVRQDTGERTMLGRIIRNLPFRFNIRVQAPFRGLMGSARAFADPSMLLSNGQYVPAEAAPPPTHPIQP